jgi:hypothetical protein
VGYTRRWAWTGFPDNRLWDWLELLVLPAVLAAWPVWQQAEMRLRAHHVAGLALAAAGAVVMIVGGYRLHWTWTGFTGNTLFDWIGLLLLPVVMPVFVLPAVIAWMTADEPEEAQDSRLRSPGATDQR